MSQTDEIDEILQGFGVDADDPARRREKACKLVNAAVEPDVAEAVFCHLEGTAADVGRVPRLVAAMALDPPRLLRTHAELVEFHVKQEERKPAKRGKRFNDGGASLREDNARLAAKADREWAEYQAAKEAGTLPPFVPMAMPWERP